MEGGRPAIGQTETRTETRDKSANDDGRSTTGASTVSNLQSPISNLLSLILLNRQPQGLARRRHHKQ